jgi:DNA-binding CsgD family transcriptional regulator/tetratricopeptide (TPR) repeat protein
MKEGGSAKWPRYAEAAATAARSVGDDRRAAGLLEEVLSTASLSRADRIRMAFALGDAAAFGTSERAISILRRVVDEEVIPAGVRGELRLTLSWLMAHGGDIGGFHREVRRAIAELRRRPALRVHAMMSLAQSVVKGDDEPDDQWQWLDRATKEVERCDDPVARIALTAQRAAILLRVGDRAGWAAAREIPRRCAGGAAKERIQLLKGYHALALTALGLGHHERAESWLAEADRLHGELGSQWWELWLGSTHACFDWVGGRWVGLEDRLQDLLRKAVAIPLVTINNELTLGSLLLARGKLDEARRTLTSALDTARDANLIWARVGVAGRLASVHLELGDAASADRAAQLGLDAVRRTGSWVPARNVALEATRALIARDELSCARELVDEFAAGLRGRDAPASKAVLASCRGVVADASGHREAAMRYFTVAAEDWAKLPHRLEAARARERRVGGVIIGGSEERRSLLLDALESFESLGAEGDARRVRRKLAALRSWRGGRKGYGEKLSPRESEVAHLAAGGKTNREIAETLVISRRTAEAHVAASLRKLRITSRDEIASAIALEKKIGSPTHS